MPMVDPGIADRDGHMGLWNRHERLSGLSAPPGEGTAQEYKLLKNNKQPHIYTKYIERYD